MKPLSFLIIVLLLLCTGGHAAIVLSPEKPVSEPRFGPATLYDSSLPKVASNGSDFLVVWRSGAARMTAVGEVLDVPSLRLPQPEYATDVDVVWDGSEYLVGWSAFPTPTQLGGLYFATVSPTGEVRRIPLRLTTDTIRQGSRFQLGRNGSTLAAAYELEPAGTVGVTLFTRTGTILRTLRFNSFSLGELATDGQQFALLLNRSIVVLADGGGLVREVTFSESVRPLDAVGDGDGFFVLAAERIEPQRDQLRAIRLTNDGGALSTAIPLEPGEGVYYAEVAPLPGEFVIAWKSTRSNPPFPGIDLEIDLWSARLAESGQLLEKRITAPTTDRVGRGRFSSPLELETNGTTVLLAWSKPDFPGLPGSRVLAMPLSPSLDGPRVTVSTQATDQRLTTVAANGGNYLLLWQEQASLRAGRVTPSGQTLDGDGITVANGDGSAAAAFDGEATLVVWSDETGTHGTRVGLDGKITEPPFRVTTARSAPSIACTTTGMCLVAWNEGSSPAKLYVARIRRGVLLDVNGVFVAENAAVAMASNRDSFLLVMSRPATPGGSILSAALIAGEDGTISVNASNFVASTARILSPKVVWDGQRYVVAWWETEYSVTGVLRASRIDRNGHSIDGPQTSWRGVEISGAGIPLQLAMIGDAIAIASYGNKILLLSRETLQVQQEVELDLQSNGIQIVGNPDGSGLVAYSRRTDNDSLFGPSRVFFRIVDSTMRRRSVQLRNE